MQPHIADRVGFMIHKYCAEKIVEEGKYRDDATKIRDIFEECAQNVLDQSQFVQLGGKHFSEKIMAESKAKTS